jgi:S-adenosylmethionine synthetase
MFETDSGIFYLILRTISRYKPGVDRANPETGAGDQGMMFGYTTMKLKTTYHLALDLS